MSPVDARRVTLLGGNFLYVIVKDGVALLPNPELAKILPAVSRTAMEHIRNSYGISVEQVRDRGRGRGVAYCALSMVLSRISTGGKGIQVPVL